MCLINGVNIIKCDQILKFVKQLVHFYGSLIHAFTKFALHSFISERGKMQYHFI